MFFYLSKFVSIFLNPLNIIFFLSIILSILTILRLKKTTILLSIIILVFSLFVSFTPLSFKLLNDLEKNAFSENKGYQVYVNKKIENIEDNDQNLFYLLDGVIVLGGGSDGEISEFRNEASLNSSAERLIKSVEIFNKNRDLKILFSSFSGKTNTEGWPDYKVAELFYKKMNVPEKNILLEKKSRNTYENILYSKDIINENETWGLITSAYHMKRVKAVIRSLSINSTIIFIPVDFQTAEHTEFFSFNFSRGVHYWSIFLHEWVGLLGYSLFGKA